MKTIHPITVIVQPRDTWGAESSSYTYAIRDGGLRSVSSYQAGDILIAGSGAKRILGKVHAVSVTGEHEEIVVTPLVDHETVDDIGTHVRDIVPERFLTETVALREEYRPAYPEGYGFAPPHRWFATLDGAYQSILSNSDVSVRLQGPERVYTSLREEPLTWEEYHALRRRHAEEARADEVREAIICLRNLLVEERENPAIFERVFRDGKAAWVMSISGEQHHVIDHNDDCPLLSAIEHQLYEASATA